MALALAPFAALWCADGQRHQFEKIAQPAPVLRPGPPLDGAPPGVVPESAAKFWQWESLLPRIGGGGHHLSTLSSIQMLLDRNRDEKYQ